MSWTSVFLSDNFRHLSCFPPDSEVFQERVWSFCDLSEVKGQSGGTRSRRLLGTRAAPHTAHTISVIHGGLSAEQAEHDVSTQRAVGAQKHTRQWNLIKAENSSQWIPFWLIWILKTSRYRWWKRVERSAPFKCHFSPKPCGLISNQDSQRGL